MILIVVFTLLLPAAFSCDEKPLRTSKYVDTPIGSVLQYLDYRKFLFFFYMTGFRPESIDNRFPIYVSHNMKRWTPVSDVFFPNKVYNITCNVVCAQIINSTGTYEIMPDKTLTLVEKNQGDMEHVYFSWKNGEHHYTTIPMFIKNDTVNISALIELTTHLIKEGSVITRLEDMNIHLVGDNGSMTFDGKKIEIHVDRAVNLSAQNDPNAHGIGDNGTTTENQAPAYIGETTKETKINATNNNETIKTASYLIHERCGPRTIPDRELKLRHYISRLSDPQFTWKSYQRHFRYLIYFKIRTNSTTGVTLVSSRHPEGPYSLLRAEVLFADPNYSIECFHVTTPGHDPNTDLTYLFYVTSDHSSGVKMRTIGEGGFRFANDKIHTIFQSYSGYDGLTTPFFPLEIASLDKEYHGRHHLFFIMNEGDIAIARSVNSRITGPYQIKTYIKGQYTAISVAADYPMNEELLLFAKRSDPNYLIAARLGFEEPNHIEWPYYFFEGTRVITPDIFIEENCTFISE